MERLEIDSRHLQHAIGALIVTLVLVKVVSVLLNPLRYLPGPTLSKWTNLRLKWEVMKGRRATYIHSLHQKYGPVVRLTPSHVCTSDLGAVKEIYNYQSRLSKSPWYIDITGLGPVTMFTMLDAKQHAERRRILANPMSETNLRQLEPYVQAKVDLTMARMKSEMSRRGYTDVWTWWIFMATDIIGDLTFGESFRTLDHGEKNQYVRDLEERPKVNMIRYELPWLVKLFPWIPKFKNVTESGRRLQGYAEQSIKRYKGLIESDPSYAKPTLFSKLVKMNDTQALNDYDMHMEAMGYLSAGTDTTAIALTYLTWELARRPDIQKALRAEISQLPQTFKAIETKDLPLLNQVIQETLRLHAPVQNSLPRMSPPQGISIGNHHIPGGIEISTQAYSMHHNEEIYPDSEKFIPSRWENATTEMKEAWFPFGAGSRVCIGQHLVRMELRLGIVHLLRTFPEPFEVADGMGASMDGFQSGMRDEDMKQQHYFLSPPRGHRCLIRSA